METNVKSLTNKMSKYKQIHISNAEICTRNYQEGINGAQLRRQCPQTEQDVAEK